MCRLVGSDESHQKPADFTLPVFNDDGFHRLICGVEFDLFGLLVKTLEGGFIVDDGHKANLIQAIQAAHDREMQVVVLSAREKSDITSLMHPEDHEIALNDLAPHEATPLMLLIINTLCDLVDHKLFGG